MQKRTRKRKPTAAERYQAATKALQKLSARRRLQLFAEFHTPVELLPDIFDQSLPVFDFDLPTLDMELPESDLDSSWIFSVDNP